MINLMNNCDECIHFRDDSKGYTDSGRCAWIDSIGLKPPYMIYKYEAVRRKYTYATWVNKNCLCWTKKGIK